MLNYKKEAGLISYAHDNLCFMLMYKYELFSNVAMTLDKSCPLIKIYTISYLKIFFVFPSCLNFVFIEIGIQRFPIFKFPFVI